MALPLKIPRRLSDDMPLAHAFEHRYVELFAELKLETVGDLRRCDKLVDSDIASLNAHLARCWWL